SAVPWLGAMQQRRRGRPMDQDAWPGRDRPDQLPAGGRVPGAGAGAPRHPPTRPGAGAAGRVARPRRGPGRTGSVIEVRALQALALAAGGDQLAGLRALAEALALAAPEGYVRVFVDEGAPIAQLLGRLTAAQRTGQTASPGAVPPRYLDRLARAVQPGAAHPAPAVPPPSRARLPRRSHPGAAHPAPSAPRLVAGVAGLMEPLSDRELQVLGLLAAGRSNQQIADELGGGGGA